MKVVKLWFKKQIHVSFKSRQKFAAVSFPVTKFRVEILKKIFFSWMHFYHESLIGMTDKFSHYFGVFVFVFSLTNVVRTVQAFSLYLGPKLYFNLNQISTYFVNKFLVIIILAEPPRARSAPSGAPWERMHPRNFGSDESMYVHPPLHVSRIGILHFKYPRVWR